MKIPTTSFYGEYSGHRVEHLERLLPEVRDSSRAIIWTAGDSSVDNKYWFSTSRPAVGGYRNVLDPPTSKADVTYWLNQLCSETPHRRHMAAINTAVEASTLNERTYKLTAQDRFLRDNIANDDILVVSVGGNDVALAPLPCTIFSIAGLMCLPSSCVGKGVTCGTCPIDDCCCSFGPSLCSCCCGCPPCLGYVRHLFGQRTQKYIHSLISKTKPRLVLVCMIYYPDEAHTPSWANPSLALLRYNYKPEKLQLLIHKGFEEGTSTIRAEGTRVVPVPLSAALDGKCSSDYMARVEPSAAGGLKIAKLLLDTIDNALGQYQTIPKRPSSTKYT
eukprot:Selendium_serpulae@DN5238_c0_g1_i2.p1